MAEEGAVTMETRELSSRDVNVLHQDMEHLYRRASKGYGLPESAYWVLFDMALSGGRMPVRLIDVDRDIPRQTVSLAIKTLRSCGLVSMEFELGSSKNKVAVLTERGRGYCAGVAGPGESVEERAFGRLSAEERAELVRLMRTYRDYVAEELERFEEERPLEGEREEREAE